MILGEITDIADGTMFVGLQTYQNNYGSPYKLCFGKSTFVGVYSDYKYKSQPHRRFDYQQAQSHSLS